MKSYKGDLKNIIIKLLLTILILIISFFYIINVGLISIMSGINIVLIIALLFIVPLLLIAVWIKNKKKFFKMWGIYSLTVVILIGVNLGITEYLKKVDKELRIKTDVNINVYDYMPFEEKSKIVKLDKEANLRLNDNLPKVDGAAALFPVYSAIVNAVYPNSVEFGGEYFNYNNTVMGYELLAQKQIDIFFGAYPSKEQIEYAKSNNTEFEYTKIGKEGFVFFVNKNNPVENLTSEQIKGIYSGEITNWKEVGGNDEKILAFQRNEGSGSQSMLKRFMGNTNIMPASKEKVNDFMGGIITSVADYKNYNNSIGFSFRYYLEVMIANPNVKMISVDGVEPTQENISKDLYPITTNLYAVTYKGHENVNVDRLLNWILSDEGQQIIEKTGYARII